MKERSERAPTGLSRRKVLAAATAIGALGVTAGGRTIATMRDDEVMGGNRLVAGALDLAVCWEAPGEDCEPKYDGDIVIDNLDTLETDAEGSGTVRLSLPEENGNNPAWLWLRSNCPSGVCGLEDALEVSMWYDEDCEGIRGTDERYLTTPEGPINDISLCEALTRLSNGIPIDSQPNPQGSITPLEPGAELCLGIDWTLKRDIWRAVEGELVLDFVAKQSRHNPEPGNPWEPRDCPPCPTGCTDESVPASNVSFCRTGGGSIPPSITHLEWTETTVTWTSEDPLSDVVLFYGPPTLEYFSPSGGFAANTAYTITRGDGDATDLGNASGGAPSAPCPDNGSQGCGVKYEFEEDNWEVVCEPSEGAGSGDGGAE